MENAGKPYGLVMDGQEFSKSEMQKKQELPSWALILPSQPGPVEPVSFRQRKEENTSQESLGTPEY